MWNDNGYQGDGGFDATNNMFSSPTQEEQQKSNKPRCMAPVTIRQVIECPEEGLKVKSIDIQVVEICGIVKSVEVSSIKVTYLVEDNTGEITGTSYIEENTETSVPVTENMYCIMIGSIRSQANEKHIMIFDIRPVTNINEIFKHCLSVIHMDLKADCLSKDIEIKHEKVKQEALSDGFGMAQVSFDMDPKFKRVYDVISRSRSENGISIIELCNALPVKTDEIKSAIDYLISEGHIFTTIDDNHYKSTDGGF